MDSLKAWLKRHSLDRHYDLFVEHSIDLEIIPELTEADFAELGLNLGDRKRIQRAVRSLGGAQKKSPGFAEGVSPFPTATAPDLRTRDEAEKRHLTMIYSDLVGSTSLANELDLEEFRDLMHRYQIYAMNVIRRHHGHVAQFIGDAVTAYFGYPGAAEDDAERAVLAAVEICENLNENLNLPGRRMQARVGITTGDLVVEERDMREGLAFGHTANLAARIMATTEPGTVALSERTKRLLGATIECKWMGKHQLKGFADPKDIWRVQAAEPPGLRFKARQKGDVLPLVNREDEMRLLESRWRAVLRVQIQSVLLSGEAGIGKSRIVEAFSSKIGKEGALRLNFQCSAHNQGNAFFPLVSLISLAARIRRSDSMEQKARKLRRLLQDWYSETAAETLLALFANLLSMPARAVGHATELSPEQLKPRLQQALIDLAIRLSDRRPVLLLFEDLHWVDPSTEEMIDLLIEHLGGHRVMILCTSRPEYEFRWTGRAGVTALSVARLEDRHAKEMIRLALSSETALPEMEAQIIRKSDGVPLFLEEMARMVRLRLDQPEAFKGDDIYALPSTLKDLLRARIDALASARDLVPVCAALGRTIYPSIVQAVTGISFETALARLDYLAEAEILVPRGGQSDRSYYFRHALIQEAAYDLMLKSRARALHRRIAEVIVSDYPDLALQQPDVLAEHYTRADMPEEARDAWRDAAAHAAGRSATEETIRHLENALLQNERIGDVGIREAKEIALRKLLNVALNTRAFDSRPVRANRERIYELLGAVASAPEDAFFALHMKFGSQLMQSNMAAAFAMCDEFDQLAENSEDEAMKALAPHNRGMATFMLGQFDDAIANFDLALIERERCRPEDILNYHASDIRPVDMAMRCWAQSLRGDNPTGVRVAIETALAQLDSEQHDFSRCFAFNILATSYQPLDDAESLLELVYEAAKISEAHKFEYWNTWSTIIRGWARAVMGESTAGIAELTAGLDAYRATGPKQITQFARTLLSDAYLRSGDVKAALATIERVNADHDADGVRYHLQMAARTEREIRAALK